MAGVNKHGVGCGCCATPLTCNLNVGVVGCFNQSVQGATVRVFQNGNEVGSGVTGSTGVFTLALPAGSYTVQASFGSRFAVASQNVTTTCTAFHNPTSIQISMVPATGYHCCSGCSQPRADTLYLTDSQGGTITLTWWSGENWRGCRYYSFPQGGSYPPPSGSEPCVSTGSASVPVIFNYTCYTRLSVGVLVCSSFAATGLIVANNDYITCQWCYDNLSTVSSNLPTFNGFTCNPFSSSWTSNGDPVYDYPHLSQTIWTLTE